MGPSARLADHTPMTQDAQAAPMMPLCAGCVGPWQVAMQMGMNDAVPLLALRAFRHFGANSDDPDAANQPMGAWSLGLQANALNQPGEHRVVAAICRTHKASSVEAGLEAFATELSPSQDQPKLPGRMVRRNGAMLAWQMHSAGAGGRISPVDTWSGLRLGGTLRLWQSFGARPVMDSQVNVQVATPARAKQQTQLWGHLGWRGLVGSDDPLVRAGGWRMPQPTGRAQHVLREDVPGYEDITRYTARMMRAQMGLGAALGRNVRLDLFGAATHLDTMGPRQGRWLRAVGGHVNVRRLGSRGSSALLSYQISRRFDGNRGPWLHMLIASL